MPLICSLLFGANCKDCSHNSTGRACRSVNGCSPHYGRMWFQRIEDDAEREMRKIFENHVCEYTHATTGNAAKVE